MISSVFKIIIFFVSLLCVSCAVSYKPMKFDAVQYTDSIAVKKDIVVIRSTDDIFAMNKNARLSRKINRKKLQSIPLFIVNNSIDTFQLANNYLDVFCDFQPVKIQNNNEIYKKIKQHYWGYGIELALGAVDIALMIRTIIQINNPTFTVSSIGGLYTDPLIYVFGAGIYNTYMAVKANKKLKKDLIKRDLNNKKIAPGDSIKGIIFINSNSKGQILLRLNQ